MPVVTVFRQEKRLCVGILAKRGASRKGLGAFPDTQRLRLADAKDIWQPFTLRLINPHPDVTLDVLAMSVRPLDQSGRAHHLTEAMQRVLPPATEQHSTVQNSETCSRMRRSLFQRGQAKPAAEC